MRRFLARLDRPVWVLLSGILFIHLAAFLLNPFFSIILASEKGLSLGRVGLVLGAGSVAYLVGSLIGGTLSDRLGRKITMIGGLLIRAVGMLTFLWVDSFALLFTANLIAGVGEGLYMPPAKAGIAELVTQEQKTTAFSYRGIAANIGVTLGPVLGTYLLTGSSRYLFLASAVVSLGVAVAHFLLLPLRCQGEECPPAKTAGSLRDLLTDRPFLMFSFVTIFVWALFSQFTMSLPLRADQIGIARQIGLIFTGSSLLVILLQTPITRWFNRVMHPITAMAIGTGILGVALASIALSASFWHLAASAVLFTLGEMFVMPTADAIVSDLAKPEQMGTYFGVSAFVFGAGEALGNVGGGQLMEYSVGRDLLAIPWLTFGVLGVVVAVAYFALRAWKKLAAPLAPALAKRTEEPLPTNPFRKKQKT
ncbi:MAG TPA: MFS transporter [Bacilli bacterium]|nr:MFS transporter [Bacilli bacterium]